MCVSKLIKRVFRGIGNASTQQQGSVMLLTIMLLSFFSLLGFTVAALSYKSIKTARTFDDSIQSFYAAESGLERALDIAQVNRQAEELLDDTISEIEAFAPDSSPLELSSGVGEYYIDSSDTMDTLDSVTVMAPVHAAVQFDMYDPDDPLGVGALMRIESAQFLWNEPTCSATTRIEVSWYEFNDVLFNYEDDAVFKQVYTCGVESAPSGWDCVATSNHPADHTNYIVRVKSLDCSLMGMQATFYSADNAGGSKVGIPSMVKVVSVGESAESQRRMSATSKWVPSVTGLVDFVLFSVDEIIK